MRVLFVTAADEAYAPLLRGLVQSLWQWPSQPFTSLACFDLGLGPETRQWLGQYATHVVEPGWDLEVSQALRIQQPHTRALTVRPFLRDYFPGYSVYLWIDSDCWVQERYALDWYLAAAARGNLAITPEVHHAYRHHAGLYKWRAQRLHAYFGREAVEKLSWATYFNAGTFALKDDAPHWNRWRDVFEQGLKTTGGKLCCDQTALNHLLWTQSLPVLPMPATCNWLCHLAPPSYDVERQRFCEPVFPGNSLGILHLAADAKDVRIKVSSAEGMQEMALQFPGNGSKG
jgi:lipopolysaccharide biosynthesis glycosyltransferase